MSHSFLLETRSLLGGSEHEVAAADDDETKSRSCKKQRHFISFERPTVARDELMDSRADEKSAGSSSAREQYFFPA